MRSTWRVLLTFAPLVACIAACGKASRDGSAAANAGGSAAGGSAGSAGSGAAASDCAPPARRLVRLSYSQLSTAVGDLLSPELTPALRSEFDIDPRRYFLPLFYEGSHVTETVFAVTDGIAAAGGEYVRDHFAELTGCAATPTHACVQEFVLGLAERAFRRPLAEPESTSLIQVLTEAQGFGATVEEAAQYGAYAVFESPLFVYRSEFGDPESTQPETRLSPYELASELSFFITGGPPDQLLIDAAASDLLGSPEAIAPHVDRLLASEAGRSNLESAMLSHIGLPNLDYVVLDPAVFPTWGEELRGSMRWEAQAFVQGTLWSGAVGDLVTSRRTRVDQRLADLYGITFPPPGAAPDAQGFADVELPETRAGILTQAATLTARSRPDGPSVISRGLWVRSSLLCLQNPPFPENGPLEIPELPAGASEREKAEARMTTVPCNACHIDIDPFGLALDQFDGIGRYRTTDGMGRPVDPAVILPESAGGEAVANAAELGAAIASGFSGCLAKSFLDYALAEGALALDSCDVRAVIEAHEASGDPSFSGLIRQIALSKTLGSRLANEP